MESGSGRQAWWECVGVYVATRPNVYYAVKLSMFVGTMNPSQLNKKEEAMPERSGTK
jgi:hypothetical protein